MPLRGGNEWIRKKNRIRVNNIESITIFHCAHARGVIKNVHKIRNICGIKMKIFARKDWCDFKVASRQCEACLQRGKIKCGEQDILYYTDNLLEKLRFRWKMCVFFFWFLSRSFRFVIFRGSGETTLASI